jgi:hypothetical protein
MDNTNNTFDSKAASNGHSYFYGGHRASNTPTSQIKIPTSFILHPNLRSYWTPARGPR